MKQKWFGIGLVFSFFMVNLAFAKAVTFEKEYTYQASEADSMISSRAIALEQVKRLLLEELGTYLESITEVKKFQLTKDEIVTLSSGIVKTEIIEEIWNGKTYFLKVKITADPNEVYNSLDKFRQDHGKEKELEETKRQVEKLKKEKGQEEVEAYSRIIKLDPKSVTAYIYRAIAYGKLKDYRQAIRDCDSAIELNPKAAIAYYCRGLSYGPLGDDRQAIRDFNKAIELLPNFAEAYSSRGGAYFRKNHYDEAIEDFNKAIEIKPNLAGAYNNRGYVYIDLENLQFAERDLKKALELYASSDRRMDSYIGLAIVYFRQGKKEEAKNYYQEAIKIDSLCKGGGEALEKERGYFYSPSHKKAINEILRLFPSK